MPDRAGVDWPRVARSAWAVVAATAAGTLTGLAWMTWIHNDRGREMGLAAIGLLVLPLAGFWIGLAVGTTIVVVTARRDRRDELVVAARRTTIVAVLMGVLFALLGGMP